MPRKHTLLISFISLIVSVSHAQEVADTTRPVVDSVIPQQPDTSLRITNLNPYFTLHVDSMLSYQLAINKDEKKYYWYLKNSPVGLKINKDNGLLTFKAEKSFFLSGKLKYDEEYTVKIGVQNLADAKEKVDTSFTLVFYNTEVILPKLKPTVTSTLTVEEGEQVSFKVQCEAGNFPIEDILFSSNITIHDFTLIKACNEEFNWTPPFDFVKETDSAKVKILNLSFIGSTKFKIRDTANVRIIVKDALNYPFAKKEYDMVINNIKSYVLRLKYTFLQLDRKLKKTKNTRTSFDLTSASTALSGTILTTAGNSESAKNTGKILPSVGLALVPVKEATAPNKNIEQNQASLIRSSIKRLDYMLNDYSLVGEKDPAIVTKTNKLKDELKQSQLQLIDVPIEITEGMTEEELNKYFNSPKVNKKYRLNKK
ncbi:MAG: hypothetical protein JNN00_11315 [Chitinophagaceae bacterium]|nr:hypothetical protein [Chitinophagaceae bacterium]